MTHHKMSNKTINLINQTHLTLTKQNIVYPTQFILITISGGQDSLCLFFILLQLKKQWKWHFGLLYCNHFWQIDSFYINSLIFKLGFFFLIPAYLSLPSENIFSEQKSRTWRYRQFNRLSTFYKYDIIFTGHTSTDKIETVLLQLLRGTGTRGLSTLDWIRPISRYKSVASPLLLKILPKVSKVYAKPKPGFPSSGETSSLGVLTQTNKPATILKTNNVSKVCALHKPKFVLSEQTFSHKFFQIEFCNQFFLSSQINCLKDNFFDKTKNTQLYKKFEKFLVQVFAENQNKVLLEKQNFLNNEQNWSQKLFLNANLSLPPPRTSLPTLVVGTKNVKIKEQVDKTSCDYTRNLGTKLFFITKTKSFTRVSKVTRLVFQPSCINLSFQGQWEKTFYGKNLGHNTVALQRNWEKISYRNTNWIYDDFLFLTLEKTPILISFYKLRYFYLKQNWLFLVSDNDRYSIFDNYKDLFRLNALNSLSLIQVNNQGKINTNYFNFLNYYSYNRNLIRLSSIEQQKLFKLKPNLSSTILPILLINLLQTKLPTFDARFARRTPFIINRRIIFKDHSGTRPVSAVANKIQFFFSLASSNGLKFSVQRKFEHYNVSWKNKRSFFAFNNVVLNQKPSKILIKYLKISCWAQFKRNFLELEVLQLKSILNLEITPFLIRSYLCLPNYKQIAIILIIYPSVTFSFFFEIFCIQTTFENLIFSQQSNGQDKKDVKYIEQLNLGLKTLSCHDQITTENLVLFSNTNKKLKSIFSEAAQYNLKTQRQEYNWDKSYFFCRASIKKENNLKETQNNAKFSKTLNLVTKTKSKIISNCHYLYLEEKTKNKKFLLVPLPLPKAKGNRPIFKMKDHKIFSSLHNKYDLSIKIGTDARLVLPIQKGFSWSERDTKQSFVVRPLLFVTRFDLKKVCMFWQLPVYPDQTNEKLVYFRNRIRKQLLPLLRFFFNPQIDKLFLQFAEIATTEQLYLDELAIHLQNKFEIGKINTFELNLSVFNFIPLAIQRRLLKQFLNQYFTKQIKFFHIKILLNVLSKRKKSHSKLYEKLTYKKNLLIRENFKVEYQMFSKVIFQKSLSTGSMTENEFLDKSEVPNLTTKIRSEFLQHFIFVKQNPETKAKLRCNLINFDQKLNVRNIFSSKNKLKAPQIFFFAGVGACFMTSRRFILLSNFIIV